VAMWQNLQARVPRPQLERWRCPTMNIHGDSGSVTFANRMDILILQQLRFTVKVPGETFGDVFGYFGSCAHFAASDLACR
jgi:hypothetical protein